MIFDHCLPFDVTRAYDEATQYKDPRIWTAQRDKDMWLALEGLKTLGDAAPTPSTNTGGRPNSTAPSRHCGVVIVGAGPVGLAAAIDLAQRDIPVLVLDDDDTVSVGSRAICYAKRTLEILDRLGCGEPIAKKGVGWSVGKVFHGDRARVPVRPVAGAGPSPAGVRQPAAVPFRGVPGAARDALGSAEIRWKHRVVGVEPDEAQVKLRVATPDGDYALTCDWLIVCDGARSPVRHMLGLDTEGQVFRDRFLIADIHMTSDFPAERWFWFDPPFHRNQSVLLHRQADNVWRVDFQLGWDADPEEEKKPENILPRLRAMLGHDARLRDRMGERLHVPVPPDAEVPPRPRAVRRRLRRTWSARSARAAPTAACRTPTTSCGSWSS